MIGPVRIQNFKSIRDLSLGANRVNLFIGEPNTGKSNIIEALAFFSPGIAGAFSEIFRFRTTADLFFDQKVSKGLSVQAGKWGLSLTFKDGRFRGEITEDTVSTSEFEMTHSAFSRWSRDRERPIKYYAFKPLANFPNSSLGTLVPPFGDNLVAVLYSNEELRQKVSSVIRSKGFRLQIKPTDNELLIAKDINDELYSYPWSSVSETLRRLVFFMAVLETNRETTLLLDEPEANTFPFYTKYLAERIALDETNQFFIATHNPYLLGSILSKAGKKDVAVFVTYMESYETKIKSLSEEGLTQILDLGSSVFFNLEKLLST